MYIYGKIKATLDKGIQTIVISEIKTGGLRSRPPK
jgi:hypothetical protein